MHSMRSIRNARTSTVIAAYRREPTFPGDITWEMVIAVTPFDKRPCHVLWDEDTVRYHVAPFQTPDNEVQWLPYCQEGARHWEAAPIFLVGLGISDYTEPEIWEIVNKVPIHPRESLQSMFKDWVWDVLPVSGFYLCFLRSHSFHCRLLRMRELYMHVMEPSQISVLSLNNL